MDKAIIIGIYEYLGFHLCLKFLEQGIEVIGVDTEIDESDLFIEEKKLSIGRNSNFTERDLSALKLENGLVNTHIFIDYYSSYVRGEEANLVSAIENQVAGVEMTSLVMLLPIQMCGERVERRFPFLQSIEKDRKIKSSFFYLPSIYGPWQPLIFALQQSLYEPNKDLLISEREWTEDAVYIEDAITAICTNLEKKGRNRYVVRSMLKDNWRKLMGPDKIDKSKISSKFPAENDFLILQAGETEPKEGTRKQKEHLFNLLGRRR